MRTALLTIGLILVILGLASLVVPIPHAERHGISAGPVSLRVQTTTRERVHPGVSAVLIAGGVVLIAIAAGKRR